MNTISKEALKGLSETVRLIPSGIAFSLTFLILFFNAQKPFIWCVIRAFPILFVTMAGFILNDIFDIKKDKIAEKKRPIASGSLSVRTALCATVIILIIVISLEVAFRNIASFFVILAISIGVIVYTPLAHKYPPIKGLFTALLSCAPLYYAAVIVKYPFPIEAYIALFIFIAGRELLLDMKDLSGDLAFGLKSLAFYFGDNISWRVSWGLMFISSFSLLFIIHNIIGLFFVICAIFSLVYGILIENVHQEQSITYSRIALFCGAIAISTIVL